MQLAADLVIGTFSCRFVMHLPHAAVTHVPCICKWEWTMSIAIEHLDEIAMTAPRRPPKSIVYLCGQA